MVQNRPFFTVLVHLTLILGVLVVALPIYVTFIASTQAPSDVLRAPIPMTMGDRLVENYSGVLGRGSMQASSGPVAPMMLNSLIMALGIAIGKIAISLLSAFAIVYFRFPGRMLAFWTIFITLMLAVYERTRELGLLRAVGQQRRQTRRMIRAESIVVSLFGAVLGVVLGLVFGVAIAAALPASVMSVITIPYGQLVIILVLAAIAGVVAGFIPAFQASKLNVLDAISYE